MVPQFIVQICIGVVLLILNSKQEVQFIGEILYSPVSIYIMIIQSQWQHKITLLNILLIGEILPIHKRKKNMKTDSIIGELILELHFMIQIKMDYMNHAHLMMLREISKMRCIGLLSMI